MSVRFSFSYFSCCYLFLLIVVFCLHLCMSDNNFDDDDVLCMGSERQALLQFKQGLIDEAGRLASWDDGEESDCCKWVGIGCDNITGHVHRIHLPALTGHCQDVFDYTIYNLEYEEALKQRLRGKLSSSLLHLKQLRHLDLSCNDFEGRQVPKFIGSLRNLRYLNLLNSNFGGSIPLQLGNLSELQVLSLGSSLFPRTMMMNSMEWLSSLHLLQHLDLSGMNLSKAVDWLQVINTLPSLHQLHLSDCQLIDVHPHFATLNLTSLSFLDLSQNNFSSSLPPWIFSITSLVTLDLSWCSFHSLIHNSIYTFRNLTSLESLHVRGNTFMNSSLVLRDLSSVGSNLISLYMSGCGVSSPVLESLHNLTSLLSLVISDNQLTKKIPKSLGCNFCNMRDLDLSGNDFGDISLTSLVESVFMCKSPPLLESLRLRSSSLSGPIPYSIGRLSSLEELYLDHNQLNGSVPYSIGGLSSLKILHLHFNRLSGPIPYSIGRLSSLEELYLSFNQLNGGIPYSIGGLSSLKILQLHSNLLSGPIPYSIGRLSSLKELDLSFNQLNGNVPYSIGGLSSLKILHLYNNLLSGPIPYSIGRLSSLKELYLFNNQLNGSLPNSLAQLSNLEELWFSSNLLTGVVTEAHFSKLVNLKFLDGDGNKLTLRLRSANWIPPFQLGSLILNSWELGPHFPLWLQSQKDLSELDISNTRISSPMPPASFWRSFPNLAVLDMSHNHIQGTLKLLHIPTSLHSLDLSSNELTGELAPLSNFSFSDFLDLSNNFFIGSLHDLLCSNGGIYTRVLNLGNNNLSGVIPECWEKWTELLFLNLENNSFSGRIPTTLGSLFNLESLNMRGNKLTGRLSASLMNLTSLKILELGRNEFEGNIPSWFGTQLLQLRILNLRSNSFDGTIPYNLCLLKHIQILVLANNNLAGNIPICFNNFSVLTGNKKISNNEIFFFGRDTKSVMGSDSLVMKGREDIYSTILGLVTLLDLSCNNLGGHIPSEITALRELKALNFSRNRLTGRIPEKIGDMKALETLDLSLNMLSGELPVSLSQLNFLSSFNVSYNNLTGRVPSSTQLQGFSKSCFFGNKLCGPPLNESCEPVEAPKKTDSDQQEDDGADWVLIVGGVIGFVSGFWIIVAPLIVSRSWRITYFGFLNKCRHMVYA